MAIGADFESLSALRLRNRALSRRVRELESGDAFAELKESSASVRRGHEARIGRLERELRAQERAAKKMRKAWFEVFEQVERERDEAVGHAMRVVSHMEERALRAERRADALMDQVTADARRIRELEAESAELKGLNAKLTAQVNRDFESSSLPSSAQGPARKRIPNTREATGRAPGAQSGHPHHPRRRPEATRTVELPDPPGWKDDPDLYRTGGTVSKTVVSARVSVEAVEYVARIWRRRSNGSRLHAPFPEGASDEVTYDGSVKALAFMLTAECCASAGKAVRFLREASGGALGLSEGMVKGLTREFFAKSGPERDAAVSALMSSPIMHADFTCANVGGDGRQVLILANARTSLMLARRSKGHKGVEGSPLASYVGCAVHDHDATFYSYGTSHQECMQHNIRYLVGSVQNEPHLAWSKEMLALLREMLHWRKSAGSEGLPEKGDSDAPGAFERRYDEILELAASEYESSPPTKYYRDGYNLSVRLRDFKDSELRFLRHPEVPPDNSLCERLARVFKRKQRQAIVFRSLKFLGYICDSIAAVNNMRLAGKDVFAETSTIFGRPMPAASELPKESVTG